MQNALLDCRERNGYNTNGMAQIVDEMKSVGGSYLFLTDYQVP